MAFLFISPQIITDCGFILLFTFTMVIYYHNKDTTMIRIYLLTSSNCVYTDNQKSIEDTDALDLLSDPLCCSAYRRL